MASHDEVASVFPMMVQRFDPVKAPGLDATIQFDLTGDNGGAYWLRFGDNKAESGEGQLEAPRMTVKAKAEDFLSMINGSMNPMQAFMTGKIKIQGDTGLAMKLMPLMNG